MRDQPYHFVSSSLNRQIFVTDRVQFYVPKYVTDVPLPGVYACVKGRIFKTFLAIFQDINISSLHIVFSPYCFEKTHNPHTECSFKGYAVTRTSPEMCSLFDTVLALLSKFSQFEAIVLSLAWSFFLPHIGQLWSSTFQITHLRSNFIACSSRFPASLI